MSHFDFYGRMAEHDIDDVIQNGRYIAQSDLEKNVPNDVISKLEICEEDTFLDVGCGLGLNLFPISKIVRLASACDHPNIIKKTRQRDEKIDPIKFYSGDFLQIDFGESKFSKILTYSVLPALPDMKTALKFADKIMSLMAPRGLALLGDISNTDKKKRFLDSKRGEIFQKEWNKKVSQHKTFEIQKFQREEDKESVIFNDKNILELLLHIRNAGYHSYLVDQDHDLPFGNTREDILIVCPDYERK